MTRVVALLPSSTARERFEIAVASCFPPAAVTYVESWPALHTALGNSMCSLAVVDPFNRQGLASSRLAALQRAFPSVTLLLYGRFQSHNWRTLLQLVQLGVQHAIAFDMDDNPLRLRDALEAALEDWRVHSLLDELLDLVPQRLHHLVELLARDAGENWSPSRLALACDCHPKTLRGHLRLAGLPSTYRLVTWFRLFAAGRLLADQGRTVQQVANALGFPSTGAMRVQMHRYLGCAPSRLRERDALPLLRERFRAECAARHEARSSAERRPRVPKVDTNGQPNAQTSLPG
jgi:AraC-like DNA-binding protein